MVEHSTADREVPGSNPGAPLSLFLDNHHEKDPTCCAVQHVIGFSQLRTPYRLRESVAALGGIGWIRRPAFARRLKKLFRKSLERTAATDVFSKRRKAYA